MRRTPFVVLPLVLAAAPAARADGGAWSGERPPLRAALEACSTGAAEAERFAVFTGSMPAYKTTRRMWMRFDLDERPTGGKRWQRLAAPTFGRWERSQADRSGFVWSKRVERLRQDREYRATVRFRWFGRDGAQTERRRVTAVCRQPDLRPDLRVATLDIVRGGEGGGTTYRVTIENTGAGAAGASEAGLVVGTQESTRPVGAVPAGGRLVVDLPGPGCTTGERVSVTLDVRGAVEESDEGDNAYVATCLAR